MRRPRSPPKSRNAKPYAAPREACETSIGRLRQRAGSFRSRRAQAFYDELAQSDAFREAESRRATAQGRLDEANKAVQKALVNQQTNEERIQDTRSDIAEVERRINKRNPSGIAMETKRGPVHRFVFVGERPIRFGHVPRIPNVERCPKDIGCSRG